MIRTGAYSVIIVGLLISLPGFAQYAGDAFRYSETNQTGTARFQGLGGNHTALGGDASSISGNPAGLGFYNRSEFSISPAFTNINTNSSYIGQSSTSSKSNFNVANASLVISSQPGFQRKWKRTSLGVSFSRQQSFQNRFSYNGVNNRSAYVDKVVQDADALGWTDKQYNDEFDKNEGRYQYLDEAYFGLQMIYPTRYDAAGQVYNPPYARDDRNNPTSQRGEFDSKGANSQWTFAFAGNYDDKLYIGGSLGFNRIRYSYTHWLEDSYNNPTVFRSSVKGEDLTVTGNGVNATFGIIYKISPVVQFGGSLTSPTFTAIKETFNQNLTIDYIKGTLKNDQGQDVGPTENYASLTPNDFNYSITSPFKGSAGVTYFLQDKGFVTGSLEYVGYKGMRARTNYNSDNTVNQDFNDDNKMEIKDTFKNTVNVRVGGEYRAGVFRGRVGVAYISDPYSVRLDDIDRSKVLFSAGLGLRYNRFFADIAGTLATFKSAYTPYVLNNVQDYSSVNISNKSANVVLTVGTFF